MSETLLRKLKAKHGVPHEHPRDYGTIYSWRFIEGERYVYDQLTRALEGWSQFDTREDAHYFGLWVSKQDRALLQYAEGDLDLTVHRTDETWEIAMASLRGRYPEVPPAARGYDLDGTVTEFYDMDAVHGRALPES
jgi:hypothetical protein